MSGIGQMFAGISQVGLGVAEGVEEHNRIRQEGQLTREKDLQSAADALQRGAVDTGRLREQGGELINRQKVAYANSGVDPTVGTAANVQAAQRRRWNSMRRPSRTTQQLRHGALSSIARRHSSRRSQRWEPTSGAQLEP